MPGKRERGKQGQGKRREGEEKKNRGNDGSVREMREEGQGRGKGAARQGRGPNGGGSRSDDTERTSFESQRQVKRDRCSRTQVWERWSTLPSSSGPFEEWNPCGNYVNRARKTRDATEVNFALMRISIESSTKNCVSLRAPFSHVHLLRSASCIGKKNYKHDKLNEHLRCIEVEWNEKVEEGGKSWKDE